MGLENNKWRVQSGDCLWRIAQSVYGNGAKWPDIAAANGLATSGNPIIYPGQLFTLPGITPGSAGTNATPKQDPPKKQVRVDWFALTAGSERNMECRWTWPGEQRFWIKWEYYDSNGNKWVQSETEDYHTTTGEQPQQQCNYDDKAKKCRVSIRPVTDNIVYDKDGNPHKEGNKYQDNTEWAIREYDFANNPPKLPPNPEMSIDNHNKMTVTLTNIDEEINANKIEIAIYKNDTIKYATAMVDINTETWFAKFEKVVDPGNTYRVRCRAARVSGSSTIYGGWTEFTANDSSLPNAPNQITVLKADSIMDQQEEKYNVDIEWSVELTATKYAIEYTTDPRYFDTSGNVTRIETDDDTPKYLITDIEPGHLYYFRVASINNKGQSVTPKDTKGWTPIKSLQFGTKPAQPTTWSNTVSSIIGEDLNLYWTHNATDGSRETYARLNFIIKDSANPGAQPLEKTITVQNTKAPTDVSNTFVYTINTSDPEWSLLEAGFSIEWKVQTSGVASTFSDWSVVRKVNVYAQPTVTLDITNERGESVSEINEFPFYLNIAANPLTQIPISYYIEVISNDSYETVDNYGNIMQVNSGDAVYRKYFDPEQDAWEFIVEMTPGIIDIQNGVNYTVNVTVSMDSGLTATTSDNYDVYITDIYYEVDADVVINYETLEASIHPYCYELDENNERVLTPNCTLSVYRREYDGRLIEIATDIANEEDLYVTDPHPSLDYARYRIVARTSDTGAISYSDINSVKVGEAAAIIQWGEKWIPFKTEEGEEYVEPAWSGSMLKLPYNIDISVNNDIDVSLIEYVGRSHPVSYYGTQLGEKFTWSMQIPAYDDETLYGIRRLANWTDNVYVRDPSGIGYWATISVNYNKNHLETTIPVSFNITRVEGGV
jgi:hypothetical protein